MKVRLDTYRELGISIALVVMIGVFAFINPVYIRTNNLIDIVQQSTVNGMLAIGITFTIITGGIDLSVGSTFAVVIVSVGMLVTNGVPPLVGVAIGIIIGLTLGIVNGLLITKMKLQPFIATLGMMSVYRGVAYVMTGGWPVVRIPREFRDLTDGRVIGEIPVSVFSLIAFAIIAHVLLNRTRFGAYLYAIGGNEQATRLSGVNVDRTKVFAYGFCGIGAALAGMVLLGRLGSGEPTAGITYELLAIAAAAVGGTSLAGGKGTITGTLLGALLLSALRVGLIVAGMDSFWQFIATGLVIVVAAYFEVIQQRLRFQRNKKPVVTP
ncbi:MAG: ABC transporter permease [Spirochaetaceae bacterium]|nr:MAG: ABC transporter permease [Spirochaetaceae bacterium]